jgi:hypothetical protein
VGATEAAVEVVVAAVEVTSARPRSRGRPSVRHPRSKMTSARAPSLMGWKMMTFRFDA